MDIRRVVYILFLSVVSVVEKNYAAELNPLSYRLKEAKTGIERYNVLLRCHTEAVRLGAKVSYKGIDTIRLEIPLKFRSIPLTDDTDFSGCVLIVRNDQKNIFLFSMKNDTTKIVVPAKNVDNARFIDIPLLASGNKLLVINDKNLWVNRRIGHRYGHIRKDVMLVTNGIGSNKPIMPYNNKASDLQCYYSEVSLSQKNFKNITFLRDNQSKYITNLVEIRCQNNVLIENVRVVTPQNTCINKDRIFTIADCTNIAFKNIKIEGTYSDVRKYGYAFNLNNVWNHTADNVYANAIWGVYGNNNINTVTLANCNLNNFEIHCYGRDITSRNCTYHDYYNHFASTYGTIRYENCTFINTIPHMNANSYNSYVPVDIEFTNCTFNIRKKGKITSFAKIYGLTDSINQRPELSKKCLPNFTIRHCTFNINKDVRKWFLINFQKIDYKQMLGYISKIKLSDITINGDAEFDLFTCPIETEKQIEVSFDNVNVVSQGKQRKFHMPSATMGRRIKMRCNGRKVPERKVSRHNK